MFLLLHCWKNMTVQALHTALHCNMTVQAFPLIAYHNNNALKITISCSFCLRGFHREGFGPNYHLFMSQKGMFPSVWL